VADEKDTDPTRDEPVDGSDAAARSPRPADRPAEDEGSEPRADELTAGQTDGPADEAADGEPQDGPLSPTSAQSPDADDELDAPEELVDEFDEDTDEDTDEDAQDSDDDRELVGVGARPSGSDRSGVARSTGGATAIGSGPQKKGRATPKQRTGADRRKRTTPAEFVRGSVAELKKVVYPSRSQLGNYFVVVLVFVLIIIAIVTGLDYGFGWVMLKLFT
jgi:preprotein translocase subunit SecE